MTAQDAFNLDSLNSLFREKGAFLHIGEKNIVLVIGKTSFWFTASTKYQYDGWECGDYSDWKPPHNR